MKITDVKSFLMSYRPGGQPRSMFVVKIETDSGLYGLGEGGVSSRDLAMEGMVEHFARILVGMDPRRIEHIWQVLYRGQYFEGGRVIAAAVSAIDIALWDLLGKSLGVPVYQLLGGRSRDYVTCLATVRETSAEAAREAVAAGWRCLRFIPSHQPDWTPGVFEPWESIALSADGMFRVREAVGPSIQLSIDLHHRYSVPEAADYCRAVAPVGLMFVEEPIRAESPGAYTQLRSMTGTPFAVGEEFASKWAFLPFIEQGLLNYARIDVCNVGGLTEARKVAGWCEAHYVEVLPHTPLGPICQAATIHLCTAINNFAIMEYQEQLDRATLRDVFPQAPELVGNHYPLPTAPGLGVTFVEEAAADHPYELWGEHQHLRRRDGAYTNF